MSLKLAGVSTAQIAERMGIEPDSVRHLINRTLRTAENRAAEEMRELENARWTGLRLRSGQVLAGDYRAVMVFLQISQRRAKLNGLDSPASVVISPNVRYRDGAGTCRTGRRCYGARSPMTDQTDDVRSAAGRRVGRRTCDDGDIRDPEAILARMPGLLLAAMPRVDEP